MEKKFIPVMITPFTLDGRIDFHCLSELINFYIESGANGLFANCLSSEMFELTEAERIELVEFVVNQTGKNIPVVATGSFGGDINTQSEFIKRIYDTGVSAVIISTNMIAQQHEPDSVFTERMLRLFNLTGDIPLGFYECPVPYKRLTTPEQMQFFTSTGRLVYHKDTSCELNNLTEKLQAVANGPQKFGLYDAYMGHFQQSLKAGAAGLSCIQGNYWPELISWLCKNFDNPVLKTEVEKVQAFLNDNMVLVHDGYPYTVKYYLRKRGLELTNFVRQKININKTSVKERMDQLLIDYQVIEQELSLQPVK